MYQKTAGSFIAAALVPPKFRVIAGRLLVALAVLATIFSMLVSGCGGDSDDSSGAVIDPGDGGDYSVTLDPADFVETIDNPWLPFSPGNKWVYEGREGDEVERIDVTVTDDNRTILGIAATVVRDVVSVDGEVIEDTLDWYAQDEAGNVWYLGEDSKEYEDGELVSTEGSWESGVDGALPGIIMQAEPEVGDTYRQEFYEGEAEDLAEVARTGDSITVPYGAFDDVLVISEWNPLEADVVEEKLYARGVGVIKEQKIEGGSEVVELVEFTSGEQTG